MDTLIRLSSADWSPIVLLAMLGVAWVTLSVKVRSTTTSPRTMRVRRPGWIARRRARAGISHGDDKIGIGYTSATRSVHITARELGDHGAVFGAPDSGKTSFLRLLIEAAAGRMPVVVVDPKGSPALEATVRAHSGVVWTLDGRTPADLLDPRPPVVAEQLLEDEVYTGNARAYGDAAHQRALWAAWALALGHDSMNLARLRSLLDRDALLNAFEPHRWRDARVGEWVDRLQHQQPIEEAGARDLDRVLGNLLDGVALGGSLGTGPEAIRLEDVIDTDGLVLFKLDEQQYPNATRKITAWVLLGMGRVAHQLPPPVKGKPSALLLVDEVGALGTAARHLRGLVGRAREAGLAVVLATQGPSDLEAVDHALLSQVLQDTAWQLVFRQGSPQDAERMQLLFGQHYVVDESWSNDGRVTKRHVERARVLIDEWMNSLQPGDAWLRVAPVDKGWRQERVRVAMPRPCNPKLLTETSPRKYSRNHATDGSRVVSGGVVSGGRAPSRDMQAEPPVLPTPPRALPAVPPDCPAELVEKMGADILAKVERRWPARHHELGPCLVWTGKTLSDADVYGWLWDPALKRMDVVHRIVWRRVYGAILNGPDDKPLEVDHKCNITLCQRPDHLQLLTKGNNVKRRGSTRGPNKRTKEGPTRAWETSFAITLFERIDRPRLKARTMSLDELVALLTQFEALPDKRLGRCWSPTKYADGAKTRGNAGVESVSALVFDCDRVPPDPKRLEGLYWIGHTTHSHTTAAPRWRLVIPLAQPVSTSEWGDVWRRARAALCPEADPACKDPSRAYWLPAQDGGSAAKMRVNEGSLLDPSTLPPLPPEPRRTPGTPPQSRKGGGSPEAYMRQVLDNVATVAPGGRNAALNHAAWTLGRWVAAGKLGQSDVEDGLYAAAERCGLVADDGQRQSWATIRSGLAAGLQDSI
jgi:hypothetical protein